MSDDPRNDPRNLNLPQDIKYMTEQEEARARLKASIDALTEQASLQAQMQKEPLKMLGGASAVGAVLGLVVGRQFRRSKKIYVDADSPLKHQKALVKAQNKQQGGSSVGGALLATLGTLAVRTVMDKVVSPRLEEVASGLLDKAGQPASRPVRPQEQSAPKPVLAPANAAPTTVTPAAPRPADSFLKTPAPSSTPAPPQAAHVGVIPMPESKVEAKAVGTPIAEADRVNPNAR